MLERVCSGTGKEAEDPYIHIHFTHTFNVATHPHTHTYVHTDTHAQTYTHAHTHAHLCPVLVRLNWVH